MKWVILIVAIMALAVAAMAIAGSMLPVKHHASRRARFGRPAAEVYAIISGPPDWRPDVKASGPLPDVDGRRRWWEQDAHGKKITYELLGSSPSRVITRIADKNLPYGGTWTVEITPAATGADVRVTEDGEVYNVIFRFLSRYAFGYTGTLETYLRNLGARLGETPQIEA